MQQQIFRILRRPNVVRALDVACIKLVGVAAVDDQEVVEALFGEKKKKRLKKIKNSHILNEI